MPSVDFATSVFSSETATKVEVSAVSSPLDQPGTRTTSKADMVFRRTLKGSNTAPAVETVLEFPRLRVTTELFSPELEKPIKSDIDIGAMIKGKSLRAVYQNGVIKDIQGAQDIRKHIEKTVQDKTSRNIAMAMFAPEEILKLLSNSQVDGCFTASANKSVGADWNCEMKLNQNTLASSCRFTGWLKSPPHTAQVDCETKPQTLPVKDKSGEYQNFEFRGLTTYLINAADGTAATLINIIGDTVHEINGRHIPGTVKFDTTIQFRRTDLNTVK